jgi:hypothetical protein
LVSASPFVCGNFRSAMAARIAASCSSHREAALSAGSDIFGDIGKANEFVFDESKVYALPAMSPTFWTPTNHPTITHVLNQTCQPCFGSEHA